VRRAALIASLFITASLAAKSVATRCETQTLPYTTGVQIRRIVSCGDSATDDTLWHLDRLDSLDGHLDGRFERTPSTALVYVFDTGVDKNHDEFADGNLIGGIDAVLLEGEKNDCGDESLNPCLALPQFALAKSHGTGVASLIGGRHVGVAPGTSIVSIHATSNRYTTWLRALDETIKHAWLPTTPQVRTAIINMSSQPAFAVGPGGVGYADQQKFEAKIRDMVGGVDRDGHPDPNGKRFLFVVAAGNSAEPTTAGGNRGQCGPHDEVVLFPSTLGPSIAGLITVGGATRQNTFWSGSCRGDAVELLGPAEEVMPAINTGANDYRLTLDSGNSWSSPIVAGVAALLLTREPDLSPAELEARLEATPSVISNPPPGAAGGRMVSTVPRVIPARRRGARH